MKTSVYKIHFEGIMLDAVKIYAKGDLKLTKVDKGLHFDFSFPIVEFTEEYSIEDRDNYYDIITGKKQGCVDSF